MDVNELRSLITVLSFISFIAILFWACSGKRSQDFREAALLPFDDEDGSEVHAPVKDI